jgi:hypothetical protein
MSTPLKPSAKARLALRVWARYLSIRPRISRTSVPRLAEALAEGGGPGTRRPRTSPYRLSRAVERSLHIGPWRPRCLTNALVLYRLLREQGDDAQLVIGLPTDAATHEAHAWVELGGLDLGPAPGRSGHEALARFP